MTLTLDKIRAGILNLPSDDAARLREWFAEIDADAWDRQIEADAAAGRLDAVLDEALTELDAGRCVDLPTRYDPPTRRKE